VVQKEADNLVLKHQNEIIEEARNQVMLSDYRNVSHKGIQASNELNSIKDKIEDAKKELDKMRVAFEQQKEQCRLIVQSANDSIENKKAELLLVEKKISDGNKFLGYIISEHQNKTFLLEGERNNLNNKILELRKTIEKKQAQIDGHDKSILSRKNNIQTLLSKIDDLKTELDSTAEEILSKREEGKQIDIKRAETLKMIQKLREEQAELYRNQAEMEDMTTEVVAMYQRLQPEYLKVFKQYANLK
jgi:chromosome segregation ATPase